MGGARHSLCSFCHKEPIADVLLTERRRNPQGKPIVKIGPTKLHLYLCEEHYPKALDFMRILERKGRNDKYGEGA